MDINPDFSYSFEIARQFTDLKNGDIITLKSGESVVFIGLKRKNFTYRNSKGECFNAPFSCFGKLIEKAEKVTNDSWKTLKPGEHFYIVSSNGKDALLFQFKEFKNNKLLGLNLISQIPTNIDIALYRGKVSELK